MLTSLEENFGWATFTPKRGAGPEEEEEEAGREKGANMGPADAEVEGNGKGEKIGCAEENGDAEANGSEEPSFHLPPLAPLLNASAHAALFSPSTPFGLSSFSSFCSFSSFPSFFSFSSAFSLSFFCSSSFFLSSARLPSSTSLSAAGFSGSDGGVSVRGFLVPGFGSSGTSSPSRLLDVDFTSTELELVLPCRGGAAVLVESSAGKSKLPKPKFT
jgi:hypothetical protein